ncbi:MAG: DUF3060 domain-containing protein [Kofleriaceae bacterium]|nr:DUF3060 domain-containing protein [Kofleriaceae bacterium]
MKYSKTARALMFIAVALAPALSPARAHAQIAITDDNAVTKVDCDSDDEVSINGNASTVTITGTCSQVLVTGNDNHVTIVHSAVASISGNSNRVELRTVGSIAVSGNANKVRWKKALGKKPQISNVGETNAISQK